MLDAHPYADLVPGMTPEQYEQLVEDIGENGLLEPVTLYQDMILDGRHRYRACTDLGLEPKYKHFTGEPVAAIKYVYSMNVHRRHLEYGQRSALGAEFKFKLQESGAVKHGGDRTDQGGELAPLTGKARDLAAKLFNVGGRSIDEAAQVLVKAPDLFEVLKDGGIGLREAHRQARAREREETLTSAPWPTGKYRVLYADPPWQYSDDMTLDAYGPADKHYQTLTLTDLKALPVRELTTDEAVLFLWSTSPCIEAALSLVPAWGFTYKAMFVWDKVKHNYGHYNSVRHELLLICTKGSCLPDTSELTDSVFSIERTEHSVKPEEFRQLIDRMYTHGPRIELFARGAAAEGWEVWGNECV